MLKQKTIKQSVEMTGVGLHSGKEVHMKLLPSGLNTGIVFHRTDIYPVAELPLCAGQIKETRLATSLFNTEGVRVSTIEHLLSALSGLGIDNLVVELNAPEVPIMDGSSNPFVFLLRNAAGIVEQNAPKKLLKIKETVRVSDGDKWAMIEPFNGFYLDFTIDFEHPAIASEDQNFAVVLTPEVYIFELSRARTFGFVHDIEYLQQNGLGLGANLDNAIGLDNFRVLNDGGLRYSNELVRHKILDAVGDLFVCGYNILGAFSAYKSGHALNNRLICSVLEKVSAWELITNEEPSHGVNTINPVIIPT